MPTDPIVCVLRHEGQLIYRGSWGGSLYLQNDEWHVYLPGDGGDPTVHCVLDDAVKRLVEGAFAAGRESMMPKPKPPIVYVKPRGVCSVCGTERALNIEGNLHGHDAPRARRRDGFGYPRNCPGSRKPPKAVP